MRCGGNLKADEAFHPAQERGLPAIDFELLGIELDGRHGRIGAHLLVRGNVLGPQLQLSFALVRTIGKPVDREAQIGQYLVIDDVVQEYGIRIEGFLRQDDAIIECPVLADGAVPGFQEISL